MKLADLGIDADAVRFGDLKTRFRRDYKRLGYDKDPIFAQIGDRPGPRAQVLVGGRQIDLETFNLLEFQFSTDFAHLEEDESDGSDAYEAGRELTDIIYYNFPFEAFRPDIPFPIGFLKQVTLRAKVQALVPVAQVSERNKRALAHFADGSLFWNTPLIQSTAHPKDLVPGCFNYRFALAFIHPSYGFIDFDGAAAGKCSESWAKWMMPKSNIRSKQAAK